MRNPQTKFYNKKHTWSKEEVDRLVRHLAKSAWTSDSQCLHFPLVSKVKEHYFVMDHRTLFRAGGEGGAAKCASRTNGGVEEEAIRSRIRGVQRHQKRESHSAAGQNRRLLCGLAALTLITGSSSIRECNGEASELGFGWVEV